jgi:hypothetical protein
MSANNRLAGSITVHPFFVEVNKEAIFYKLSRGKRVRINVWHQLYVGNLDNILPSKIVNIDLHSAHPFRLNFLAAINDFGREQDSKPCKSSILGTKFPDAAVSIKQRRITGLSPRNIEVSIAENNPWSCSP